MRSQIVQYLLPFYYINCYANAAHCYVISTLPALLKIIASNFFLANYKINVSIIPLFLFLFTMNASHAIPVPR